MYEATLPHPKTRAIETSPPVIWNWEAVAAATVILLGVFYYVGDETLRVLLAIDYDYRGSPPVLFSYYETLMAGVDFMSDQLMPSILWSLVIAGLLSNFLSPVWRKAILVCLIIPFMALPMSMATPELAQAVYDVTKEVPFFITKGVFALVFLAALECFRMEGVFRLHRDWGAVMLAVTVGFSAWYLPQIVPPVPTKFATVRVEVRDAPQVSGSLLGLSEGVYAIGVAKKGGLFDPQRRSQVPNHNCRLAQSPTTEMRPNPLKR